LSDVNPEHVGILREEGVGRGVTVLANLGDSGEYFAMPCGSRAFDGRLGATRKGFVGVGEFWVGGRRNGMGMGRRPSLYRLAG
jgi:hypothetical protein